MKKLLIVFFILVLTHCSANASTTVQYNKAGVPIYISRNGGTPKMIYNFGKNTPIASTHKKRYRGGVPYNTGHYKRPCEYDRTGNRQMAMTHQAKRNQYLPQTTTVSKNISPTVSRYDKNYTVQAPKSYYRNGITYYN